MAADRGRSNYLEQRGVVMGVIIIAPPDRPQVFQPPPVPPPPPAAPKIDSVERRILDLINECEPLKLWQALNLLADEMSPRNRDEGREARMNLWHKVRRLIVLGLLHRGRRNLIATYKFMAKPTIRRARRRKPSVARTTSTKAVSEVKSPSPPKQDCRPIPFCAEVVFASHGGQQPPPTEAKTESVPSPEAASAAASTLARIPRQAKNWSGWLNDQVRSYRNMRVAIPGGEQVYVYGALRGRVVFTSEPHGCIGDPDLAGVSWGVVPASLVQVVKNPHAVALGKRKAGVVEIKSEAKARAAQLNGLRPCHKDKRRGRPRNTVGVGLVGTDRKVLE